MEPITDKRPWGSFEQFTHNEKTTVKIISVNPHQQLSLQYHHHRKEYWKIISGSAMVQIGDKKVSAMEGDEFIVVEEQRHRITTEDHPVKILEISYGDFDEADIVRLEDKYGRT